MLSAYSNEYQQHMSQGKTKPTIRLVRPVKTQISLHIRAFAGCMYLLQPPDYLNRVD